MQVTTYRAVRQGDGWALQARIDGMWRVVLGVGPFTSPREAGEAVRMLQDEERDALAERTCTLCDAVGHGYPGAGPCPLEERGWEDAELDRLMEARFEEALLYS